MAILNGREQLPRSVVSICVIGVMLSSGCPNRPQSPLERVIVTRSQYQELCRSAVENEDLAVVAWYRNAEDAETIMDVFFEAKIPAVIEGSVLYSVEVRNQDIEKARTIFCNDKRLAALSIKIDP